jgi:uridylate kinase
MEQSRIILSVGGSIIIPKTGFDISFLKAFRKMISDEVKKGQKFIIVVGGGATCRQYQAAARETVPSLSLQDIDMIGIHTTWYNAQFVKYLLKDLCYPEIVNNPTRKIKTNKPVIVVSGWKPGCSTDKDAVLMAKTYGVKSVINLTNIDYVFDKDPNKYTDAVIVRETTWKIFRDHIVGHVWKPGMNAPFDPIASKLAEASRLTVSIVRGTNLPEVKKAIQKKKFIGTVIHS